MELNRGCVHNYNMWPVTNDSFKTVESHQTNENEFIKKEPVQTHKCVDRPSTNAVNQQKMITADF